MPTAENPKIEFELEDESDDALPSVEPTLSPDKRALITESKDLSLRELRIQIVEGDLKLNPSFQRQYVYDDLKASRLVESLLMDVPLPLVYLAQEADETNEVIDGQQRLTSFMRFFDGEFALRGLTVFQELNGKKFTSLPNEIKGKLQKSTLRCIIIKQDSDPEIKFDIFERLNSGSIHLNQQELRNCICRGSYSDFLRESALMGEWLKLFGAKTAHKRMIDCEMILRFFAFYHGLNTYSPPMSKFLNAEMNTHRNASPEKIEEFRQLLIKSVRMTWTVFGDQAFKRIESGNKKDPNSKFDKKLNLSLFDIVMVGFSRYQPRDLVSRSDAVRDKLYELMTTNEDFNYAILSGTSSKSKAQKRFLL